MKNKKIEKRAEKNFIALCIIALMGMSLLLLVDVDATGMTKIEMIREMVGVGFLMISVIAVLGFFVEK